MIHHTHAPSSISVASNDLQYPIARINSATSRFTCDISFVFEEYQGKDSCDVRSAYLSKIIKTANAVRRQIHNISIKVGISVQLIFVSQKLEQVLKPKEVKPPIVNQQYMAYSFLRDWCRMDIKFLATLSDIFTNALLNKRTQWLANAFWRTMWSCAIWVEINFLSYSISAVGSWNALIICVPDAFYQTRWQSTPQHTDLFNLWKALLGHIFLTHLSAFAFNLVLHF